MPRALITGITGQDGSYLAELLLDKGYEVHGIVRRASQINTQRIDHLYQDPHAAGQRLFLHYGDMLDGTGLAATLRRVKPDELYNLAAQSHVGVSFEQPVYTTDTIAMGTLRLLEAVRLACIETRFYQASTSEMFGNEPSPQDERTPFRPRSPYACAKVAAHQLVVNYRDAYNMHASCGILFNHESPRRDPRMLTRKVSLAVAAIQAGRQECVYLGNLDARRDWGYAPEYVEAMWRMLQQDAPDDYVVATGEMHSVREWCEAAFTVAGITLNWHGADLDETGVDADTGKALVRVDARYFRPAEVDLLCGDAEKAHCELAWTPATRFADLVRIMVEADMEGVQDGVLAR